jgi:hypothetical protein
MRNDVIGRLAAANPVPHDRPLHRPEPAATAWRSSKPVLGAAIAVAALAAASIAVAAGFGAFSGISAAQHPPSAADKLDPSAAALVAGDPRMEADSARFVTQLPDGVRIYAVATATGGLCALAERLPNNDGTNDAAALGCGLPLTQAQPTTVGSFQANESTPPISYGVALDNVAAVSFMAGGQEVTAPVENNVWAYEGENSAINSLTVHFKDGSTTTIGWDRSSAGPVPGNVA